MNRRKFLGMLGLAPLVAKIAPLLKTLAPASTAYRTYLLGKDAVWEGTPLPRPLTSGDVSYRFKFVVASPIDANMRFRTIHAEDSIA